MALLVTLTGCATSELVSTKSRPAKSSFVKATANNPAVKCLCVWQTAEGYDPEGKPCRGAAGQIFFFNRDSAVPVVVQGDVHVFVFDDQSPVAEQAKPIHEFDIDRQTWNSQLISTQFGPAYRLFVPYTRPGRHQAQMAIRLRMTPDQGPIVFSDLATIEFLGYPASTAEKSTAAETNAQVSKVLRENLRTLPPTSSSFQVKNADGTKDVTGDQTEKTSPVHTIARVRTLATPRNEW
jgi:hypothetical protein